MEFNGIVLVYLVHVKLYRLCRSISQPTSPTAYLSRMAVGEVVGDPDSVSCIGVGPFLCALVTGTFLCPSTRELHRRQSVRHPAPCITSPQHHLLRTALCTSSSPQHHLLRTALCTSSSPQHHLLRTALCTSSSSQHHLLRTALGTSSSPQHHLLSAALCTSSSPQHHLLRAVLCTSSSPQHHLLRAALCTSSSSQHHFDPVLHIIQRRCYLSGNNTDLRNCPAKYLSKILITVCVCACVHLCLCACV